MGGMRPSHVQLVTGCGTTKHFVERARTRGLAPDVADFIVLWGATVEGRDGATYFTVVRRELPAEVRDDDLARRADGWVLVVAERGWILTCYRCNNAWRWVRRRAECRRRAA